MPYARAPGRSVTAATSGRARRDSLGTSIGHEPARDGSAPYGPATLGATAPLGAGAAINRHRYVHGPPNGRLDRKSTRLNSSHGYISYAVFCLKKKKTHKSRNALTPDTGSRRC